jgi:hypothetical protein
MSEEKGIERVHPKGERKLGRIEGTETSGSLDTFAGKESDRWMKHHLKASYEPLLEEPWIMDMDSTVKPLYGHQEGAKLGYNPSKPGRPSHVYHTDFIANLRIVLEVEVQAGNQAAPSYAKPASNSPAPIPKPTRLRKR